MKTLAAFYFSGTGNTRYIAEYLVKKLSSAYKGTLYDVTKTEDPRPILKEADAVLLAFPIYGSAPPIPMRRFVHRFGRELNGKETILLETQYFFSGDGAASLGRTVEQYGGKIIGAEMFNMPNNLSDCKIFPVRNGSEIARTLRRARKRADKFAEKLLSGKRFRRGFSPFPHAVGYFCQRKYWRKGETKKRSMLKIDPSVCVGCGLCVKHCPVSNLKTEEGSPLPLGKCVFCYRCVNLCPRRAISLIDSAPPQIQYKGPF